MNPDTLKVALISDVFPDEGDRLDATLHAATDAGAQLALLPELPLHPWVPAHRNARDEDAELPEGARFAALSNAARNARVALLGGVIERQPTSGRRHNAALLFDANGALVARYHKLHLPEEEGFWETSHYEPGDSVPGVSELLGLRVGIQICSDANRPEIGHVLAAAGAELLLVPRATPTETYPRWRTVLTALAITSCTFVASINRPAGRAGEMTGAPSLLIAPDGEILVETEAPLAVAEVDRTRLVEARRTYPGYLPVRSALYADGWQRIR